jgi:hypothetical protein
MVWLGLFCPESWYFRWLVGWVGWLGWLVGLVGLKFNPEDDDSLLCRR